MSRSEFSLLAAGTTVVGLTIVVLAAHSVPRLLPSPKRILAGSFLVIYGVVIVLRLSGWPFIDLAVLTGAVGGVLLLEGGLQNQATVVVFLSVAAIVDVASMSGGVSHLLIERYRTGRSDFLLYLTLVVPISGRPIPIVGIGDLLVGGAAATALLRLGFRYRSRHGDLRNRLFERSRLRFVARRGSGVTLRHGFRVNSGVAEPDPRR